ncbi:hypothetical protein DF186_24040, partial [Enterococcus hirae]
QHNYSQKPPLQYSPSPYPSIQKHYNPIYKNQIHQETEDRLKKTINRFQTTTQQLKQILIQ